MSRWTATSAKKVCRALQRIGWREKPRISSTGSHRQLENLAYPYQYIWAFHGGEEIGPAMLAKIANRTGLRPEDQ